VGSIPQVTIEMLYILLLLRISVRISIHIDDDFCVYILFDMQLASDKPDVYIHMCTFVYSIGILLIL
jgi:hypothetical protein